mgnify:CR=1 FL=1
MTFLFYLVGPAIEIFTSVVKPLLFQYKNEREGIVEEIIVKKNTPQMFFLNSIFVESH